MQYDKEHKRKRYSDDNFRKLHHYEKASSSRSGDYKSYGSSRMGKSDYDCRRNRESEDKSFSFTQYKHELSSVFFRGNALINAGTQEYSDFWLFLKKYESMQAKSGSINDNKNAEQPNTLFGFSKSYKQSLQVNMSFLANEDEIMSYLPPMDKESGRWLSKDKIVKFQEILLLYMNFKQKEKFNKLKKLRKSQANLPVTQFKDKIVDAVNSNQMVIIAGDTGCGKSTQVPQYLLKAGYKNIACTQPRRIACISLSKRVAYETLNEYGSTVGYQIRFEKNKTQHTRIVFITEGLLLRQVSTDPSLSSYDVIVLDEIHERHLPGDFLLGVLKCLLYQRKDLKLVLMSATINIQLFQDYFLNEAVVIQVPGRLYPIKLNYHPISMEEKTSKSERINPAPFVRILQLIDEKYPKNERGDVLIFLSGMSEISTVVEAALTYAQQSQNWIILPLHSTLSIAEQDKVFDYPPEGVRKCIISTNIAETSITIDGIRFVVDSGKVKEMSYDSSSKMQRLKEFWISRASAEQRKGRAGRTGPGVCFRLYSENEFVDLQQYSTPEIQRVPLDSLLLQMVSMGLPDSRKFPFLEPPPPESIEQSILTLKEQGALTDNEKMTTIGKVLSQLPVDITIGKMLIMGSLFHQVEPVLSLAAALSVQSPFTNRAYRDPDCETARKTLESDHGDPITLLNALKEWLEEKSRQGANTRTWCKRRGLEEQRFYEMTKLRRQFKDLLQESGLLEKCEGNDMAAASSAERAIRHGELKLLRSMKRAHDQAGPRKRKILRLDLFNLEGGDNESDEIDIKDVEFRLRNDSSQVQTARKTLESDHGDPITLLNALKEWLEEKSRQGANTRTWCKRRGLEEQRFYEMTKLRRQFKDLLQESGLLEKCEGNDMAAASSAERAIRHGELKLLRSMKRAHDQAGPRKRKILRLDLFNLEGGDNESDEIDIKDVEFRLRNDSSQVQNLLSGSTACSYKDLMMLKVILCSGLYPQAAIADEFNYCKSAPEQLFHTRGKPYIALHPMSFFGNHPNVLHLEESDILVPRSRTSKLPISSKHQILFFLSLLETTKPYLMNTMRMPAAQTLLLFSQSIDTNSSFSRVVCDTWLEVEFLTPETGEALILKIVKLRSKWERLLNLRLSDTSLTIETSLEKQEGQKTSTREASHLEYELSQDIVHLMHAEVFYSLRRLLAADQKCLYVGPGQNTEISAGVEVIKNPLKEDWECAADPKKGGVRMTEYLTYNCLYENVPEEEEGEPWKCPNCDLSAYLNPMERLQHRIVCKNDKNKGNEDKSEDPAMEARKPNAQAYQCPDCQGKTLYLTPTEMLRHKKGHVTAKD